MLYNISLLFLFLLGEFAKNCFEKVKKRYLKRRNAVKKIGKYLPGHQATVAGKV